MLEQRLYIVGGTYTGYYVVMKEIALQLTHSFRRCSIRSNKTAGTIIPPVRSARLTTKGKKTMKYGRVEVTAKMPKGDWLWPAIWMMPVRYCEIRSLVIRCANL